MFENEDFIAYNGILDAECMNNESSSCDTFLTITDCQGKNVFSTINNTLKLKNEWAGFEMDTKTKDETYKKEKSHAESVTSVAWTTSVVIDGCEPENKKLVNFIDKLRNAGNTALLSFINNAILYESEYDNGSIVTKKYKIKILGIAGLKGYDGDNINETEISIHAYGNPVIVNQKMSDIKFDFNVVAGTSAGTYLIKDPKFLTPTQDELCDATFPINVYYAGKFQATSNCTLDNEMQEIIRTQLYLLKDGNMATISTLVQNPFVTSQSNTFSANQYGSGYVLKQVYAFIKSNNGTFEMLGRVPIPSVTPLTKEAPIQTETK